MDVDVTVVAPVVAALVSGSDAVVVIDAVDEHATCGGSARYRWYAISEARRLPRAIEERIVVMLTKLIDP